MSLHAMDDASSRRRGVFLSFLAMLLWSADGVGTKYSEKWGGSPASITCWKQLVIGTVNLFWSTVMFRRQPLPRSFTNWLPPATRLPVLLGALLAGLTNLGYVYAYLETSAANAFALIGLGPIWSALFGRLFLKDRLPRRTQAVVAVGACCLLLVWSPHFLAGHQGASESNASDVTSRPHADVQPNTWWGDLTALGTGMSLGACLTVARHLSRATPSKDFSHVVPLMNACGCLGLAAGDYAAAAAAAAIVSTTIVTVV